MISWVYQNHPKNCRIGKALEYTRNWGVKANVKKCAVVVCNEDKVNPVNFK